MKYIKNISTADLSFCDEADSFLQSAMWGRFKSRFGWEAKAFAVDWAGAGVKPLLALCRRIAPGFSMTYIPWGPEFPQHNPSNKADATAELARALRPFLPRTTAFIRIDPPWFVKMGSEEGSKMLSANRLHGQSAVPSNTDPTPHSPLPTPHFLPKPFKRAAADIQPPDTVMVDLTLSCDDILAAMKPKWRYNIGLAEKRGVVVSCNDGQDIDVFYRLLTETAARDGIAVHSIEYYRALFDECRCNEGCNNTKMQLVLYTAKHEGDIIAAIVVLRRKKQAVYLYGASANIKRNLMAPYALQWKAMQDAKASGCTHYDLFGIPPNEDPDHPMAGLYRFKTGFGGSIFHRPGSWDYPYKPVPYTLFSGAEYLRKKMRDKKKVRN